MKRVAIIGTGLIGASLGLALRKRAAVVGWDPDRANLSSAKRMGALTSVAPNLERALARADAVILAAPVRAIVSLIPEVFPRVRPLALVVDVGGVKAPIVAAAVRALRSHSQVRFVAGHPMAGSESSGPSAARADLFVHRLFALYAPPQPQRASALRAARKLVKHIGATPVIVGPKQHDRAVSATSALPQIAAVALALAVIDSGGRAAAGLVGPGLEGATRLAGSSFAQWQAGLLENSRNVRRAIRAFERRLASLRRAIDSGDVRLLEKTFRAAAAARARLY